MMICDIRCCHCHQFGVPQATPTHGELTDAACVLTAALASYSVCLLSSVLPTPRNTAIWKLDQVITYDDFSVSK